MIELILKLNSFSQLVAVCPTPNPDPGPHQLFIKIVDLDSVVFINIFYIGEFSTLRIGNGNLQFSESQKGFVNQSLEEFISRCKELIH